MKKILLLLPIVLLLSAGCQKTTQPTVDQTAMQQNLTTLAILNVSGSTNTVGYSINFYNDGSAIVSFQDGRKQQKFGAATVDSKALTDLLSQIGDVSKIKSETCLKSVSFGVTETISYNNKISGDLDCVLNGDSSVPANYKNLASFINQVGVKLNINVYHR